MIPYTSQIRILDTGGERAPESGSKVEEWSAPISAAPSGSKTAGAAGTDTHGEGLSMHGLTASIADRPTHRHPTHKHVQAVHDSKTPSYTGLECYESSIYPAEECPFTGMCLPGSTCTRWRTGSYSIDDEVLKSSGGELRDCPCGADCDGKFVLGHWTPEDPSCPPLWLSPSELRQRFRGRRTVFYGDSLVRQVFQRTLAHLRGFNVLVEHFFHGRAAYAMNGTHDVLSLDLDPRKAVDELLGPKQVDIEFRWSPKLLPSRAELDAYRPQIVILALNVHITKDRFKELKVGEHMSVLVNGSEYLEHVVWLTTANSRGNYSWRNAEMRSWAAEVKGRTNVSVSLVGMDKLAEQSPWGRNKGGNDVHFQCSFLDMHPQPIKEDAMMYPDSVDCRDWFNLNVVNLIMGRL
jgi:hypothetical protein